MARNRASSIQYWLYSVLATRFGAALRLSRTHVARMYEVNRHDFEAQAAWKYPGDRCEFAAGVNRFLVAHLEAAGYQLGRYRGYVKRIEVKGAHYEVCVTVRYEPKVYGVKNDTVSLGVSLCKQRGAPGESAGSQAYRTIRPR